MPKRGASAPLFSHFRARSSRGGAATLDLPRFPGTVQLTFENIRDSLAGVSITIGVAGVAHLVVLGLVLEEQLESFVDSLLVRADEFQSARIDAFGAFRGVAHHEHRHAVTRAFFLDSTGIGEAQVRTGLEVVAVEHLDRLDDVNLVAVAQFLLGGLTDYGIHVNRVNRLAFGMFVQNSTDGAEHVVHGLAQVFASVRRNENQFAIADPVQFRVGVIFTHRMLHGINHRVARDVDVVRILALLNQVVGSQLRGRKIVLAHDADSLAVEFFRVRGENVVCTQTGLHMADRNLQVETGQHRDERRRSIAMDKHDIGAFPCCAGAGCRGTEPWRYPTAPPPRGPSAGYERPSRPFGLPSLTQMRATRSFTASG